MIKMLIGMLKTKRALKKYAEEDLASYPEGYKKISTALNHMGNMGKQLELGMLLFLLQ